MARKNRRPKRANDAHEPERPSFAASVVSPGSGKRYRVRNDQPAIRDNHAARARRPSDNAVRFDTDTMTITTTEPSLAVFLPPNVEEVERFGLTSNEALESHYPYLRTVREVVTGCQEMTIFPVYENGVWGCFVTTGEQTRDDFVTVQPVRVSGGAITPQWKRWHDAINAGLDQYQSDSFRYWDIRTVFVSRIAVTVRMTEPHFYVLTVDEAATAICQSDDNDDVLPSGWRSDARLIRVLSDEYSEQAALDQRRAPLIWIGDHAQPIWTYIERPSDRSLNVEHIDHLPWDDFVLDLGRTIVEPVRIEQFSPAGRRYSIRYQGLVSTRTWVRIITAEKARAKLPLVLPWLTDQERSVIHAMLAERPTDILFMGYILMPFRRARFGKPLIGLMPRAMKNDPLLAFDRTEMRFARVTEATGRNMALPFIEVMGFLQYIQQMPEYLVEERPAPVPMRKQREKDAKPWTRTDLPHVILLDPRHQVRRSDAHEHGGSHASPVPHSRRGGAVTLLHPRYYDFPYETQTLGEPVDAPPLASIIYDFPTFLAGTDREDHPRVYKRISLTGRLSWQEIAVRHTWRRPAWVGPLEYEGVDGKLYRVLEKESGMEGRNGTHHE